MGGVLGGKQSGSSQTTQTQNINTGPWSAQQPFLLANFNNAANLYNNNPIKPYSGPTVSPLTDAQNSALGQIIGQGSTASPTASAANGYLTSLLKGNYLDPSTNPYLAGTFKAASQPVVDAYMTATAPQTSSALELGNRFGSGAYQNLTSNNEKNLGTTLDNLASNIYGGAYQTGLNNMTAGLSAVPSAISSSFINPTQALEAGNQQQQQNQNTLTGQINQYMQGQLAPWQTAQLYQGLISGNYGQNGTVTGTASQPIYSNPFATGVGSLLGLGSLATPGASGTSAAGNIISGVRSLLAK